MVNEEIRLLTELVIKDWRDHGETTGYAYVSIDSKRSNGIAGYSMSLFGSPIDHDIMVVLRYHLTKHGKEFLKVNVDELEMYRNTFPALNRFRSWWKSSVRKYAEMKIIDKNWRSGKNRLKKVLKMQREQEKSTNNEEGIRYEIHNQSN